MVSLISFELQQWKLSHQLINTWPANCELVEVSLGSWLLLERLHLSIPGSARRTQDVAENLGVSMGGLENLASQAYLSTELKWKQPTLFYLTWSALNAKPKKQHLQYLIMNAQGVSTNTTTRKCRICRIYGYHLTLRFRAGASTPSTLADLKLGRAHRFTTYRSLPTNCGCLEKSEIPWCSPIYGSRSLIDGKQLSFSTWI